MSTDAPTQEFADIDDDFGGEQTPAAETAVVDTLPESTVVDDTPIVDEIPVDTTEDPYEYADPDDDLPSEESVVADAKPVEGGKAKAAPDSLPQSKPSEVSQEVVTEIPDTLLKAANLTAEQAKAKGLDARTLEAIVAYHDEQMISAGKALLTSEAKPTETTEAVKVPAQESKPAEKKPDAAETADLFKLELDPNEWDPATIKLMEQVQAKVNAVVGSKDQQIKALTDKFSQIQPQLQTLADINLRQEQQRYAERFDKHLSTLGDQWGPILGKEKGKELPPDSPLIKSRIELDGNILMLAKGRASKGLPELPFEEVFDRALRITFPQQHDAFVRDSVAKTASKSQSQFIQKPTSRQSKPLTGEERAIQRVGEILKSKGFQDQSADDEDFSDGV